MRESYVMRDSHLTYKKVNYDYKSVCCRFTEKDKPSRLPWFIRSPFANFLYYSTPITEGLNDRAHHEHHLMAERVGGVETRPVNVSVIYGIKT